MSDFVFNKTSGEFEKRNPLKRVFYIFLIILTLFYFGLFSGKIEYRQGYIHLLIAYSILLTVFLIRMIVNIFLRLSKPIQSKQIKKYGLADFLIGDEGGYSLSRLQAVLWAMVIFSYQVSVLLCLLLRKGSTNNVFYYELDFSESAIWLLGLSLASCLSVKGITVDKIKKDSAIIEKKKFRTPKIIDIITGDNGLDFSKCQMLAWTIVAIFVFWLKVYDFDKAIYKVPTENLSELFNHHYEEYHDADVIKQYNPNKPFVPYLPWTFIVLMGLSQGAYIGKKLVPSFKLDDLQNIKEKDLSLMTDELKYKKMLLENIQRKFSNISPSAAEQESMNVIQLQIDATQRKIDLIQKDINDIRTYRK